MFAIFETEPRMNFNLYILHYCTEHCHLKYSLRRSCKKPLKLVKLKNVSINPTFKYVSSYSFSPNHVTLRLKRLLTFWKGTLNLNFWKSNKSNPKIQKCYGYFEKKHVLPVKLADNWQIAKMEKFSKEVNNPFLEN